MASPGEETGAGHGVGGLKVTTIIAETDLERRVLKLHIIYSLRKRKGWHRTGLKSEEKIFNGDVAGW
jgi:hypothetical protein